jgi:hypothetical protein
MIPQWTPLRWPGAWKDPSALSLVENTAINCLLVDDGADYEPVRARARQQGLQVARPASPPAGVTIVKGEWPGVKMRGGGGGGQASAGPTGVAWVDSNGWNIRLSGALHPQTTVWVDAPPPQPALRLTGDSYLVAVADSAAHGGRWIVSLDDKLASGLAARNSDALAAWKRITAAAGFFAAHKPWAEYNAFGNIGVVSDFTGANEFFGQELLNLMARAGGHYRILHKDAVTAASFAGLRAVVYADGEPPSAALRKQILGFVETGGMLITYPKWGPAPGTPANAEPHPRYSFRSSGKGRIALGNADPDDPYVSANDIVVLLSHRYDLVRFWNGGATASYYTFAPDRKQAVVHLLFYANRGPDSASVRIAGRFRAARASTVDAPLVPNLDPKFEKDAVEVHLPQVSQYVAVELEV